MSQQAGRFFMAFIAVLALLGYVALVALALFWSAKSGNDPAFFKGRGTTYLTTGLASLVGGVVAAGFAQAPAGTNDSQGDKRRTRNLRGLGQILAPTSKPVRSSISFAYAFVYIVLGTVAAGIWVWKGDAALDSVKALASATAGLVLAVTGAYFHDPTD